LFLIFLSSPYSAEFKGLISASWDWAFLLNFFPFFTQLPRTDVFLCLLGAFPRYFFPQSLDPPLSSLSLFPCSFFCYVFSLLPQVSRLVCLIFTHPSPGKSPASPQPLCLGRPPLHSASIQASHPPSGGPCEFSDQKSRKSFLPPTPLFLIGSKKFISLNKPSALVFPAWGFWRFPP